jgi:hypothetical protein
LWILGEHQFAGALSKPQHLSLISPV